MTDPESYDNEYGEKQAENYFPHQKWNRQAWTILKLFIFSSNLLPPHLSCRWRRLWIWPVEGWQLQISIPCTIDTIHELISHPRHGWVANSIKSVSDHYQDGCLASTTRTSWHCYDRAPAGSGADIRRRSGCTRVSHNEGNSMEGLPFFNIATRNWRGRRERQIF